MRWGNIIPQLEVNIVSHQLFKFEHRQWVCITIRQFIDQHDAYEDEMRRHDQDKTEATHKVSQTQYGTIHLGAPAFRTKFVPSFEEIEHEHQDDVAFRGFRIKLQQYLPRYSNQVAQWLKEHNLPLRLQLKPTDRVRLCVQSFP